MTDGTNIYAGASGVWKSSNDGASWSLQANAGFPGTAAIVNMIYDGAAIWAASNQGIFTSSDEGTSWTAMNNGLTNLDVRAIMKSGSNLIATTYATGVFISTDNGNSWTAASNGFTPSNGLSLTGSGNSVAAGCYPSKVFISNDNGFSWTLYQASVSNLGFISLAASNTNLLAGTNGRGVFKYDGLLSGNSEYVEDKNLIIYPNPTVDGSITIEILNEFTNGAELEIYSQEGKTIYSETLISGRTDFNIDKLSKGIYFVKISISDIQQVEKFVIE